MFIVTPATEHSKLAHPDELMYLISSKNALVSVVAVQLLKHFPRAYRILAREHLHYVNEHKTSEVADVVRSSRGWSAAATAWILIISVYTTASAFPAATLTPHSFLFPSLVRWKKRGSMSRSPLRAISRRGSSSDSWN